MRKTPTISTTTKKKIYTKAGDFFLDLSKLVFGGVILAGIMGLDVDKTFLFITGIIVVLLMIWFGFLFLILGYK